ncbi:DNA (cytosine-5-)-methyltransferase 3 beta%2C duplicate a isoform X2 [Xyrichtys novacula]|uniref:DNA (Cytosine-5-)-methyltransferase 3 beta, duplicate a isoform X2 n=1 Tax=Xyrichtys novacula TaxID=13765 RepID=A0AAV1FU68_XYRNO|nr:DNA (cytosine-5-)-methyltransferase 3 beta%2C duplicate a isoform X2 [Xyrichtys novacula]
MKYSRNKLLELNDAAFRQLPAAFIIPAEITRSTSSTPGDEKRRRRRYLVSYLESCDKDDDKTNSICSQLQDPKLRATFLFLDHALKLLHNFQKHLQTNREAARDDLLLILKEANSLLGIYTSYFLHPQAAACFLKGHDPQFLKNKKFHLQTPELSLGGKTVVDFLNVGNIYTDLVSYFESCDKDDDKANSICSQLQDPKLRATLLFLDHALKLLHNFQKHLQTNREAARDDLLLILKEANSLLGIYTSYFLHPQAAACFLKGHDPQFLKNKKFHLQTPELSLGGKTVVDFLNVGNIYTDLVSYFESCDKDDDKANSICSQLQDPKLRATLLFLDHALKLLHNFQKHLQTNREAARDDLLLILKEANSLLGIYTSYFLHPQAAACFLKGHDPQFLKNKKFHLQTPELSLGGKTVVDFLNVGNIYTDLVSYFESCDKDDDKANSICSQLQDPKLRATLLFLDHALKLLHNFQKHLQTNREAARDDLLLILKEANSLLGIYTSYFLHPQAAACFLKGHDPQFLKNKKFHLQTPELSLGGKTVVDFLNVGNIYTDLVSYFESCDKDDDKANSICSQLQDPKLRATLLFLDHALKLLHNFQKHLQTNREAARDDLLLILKEANSLLGIYTSYFLHPQAAACFLKGHDPQFLKNKKFHLQTPELSLGGKTVVDFLNVGNIYTDLVSYFESCDKDDDKANSICSQLQDPKLRATLLFLDHALKLLHNFQKHLQTNREAARDDLLLILKEANSLLGIYTSYFLHPQASACFLKGHDPQFLKNKKFHLQTPELSLGGKTVQQQRHGEKKDHLEQVAVAFICALVLVLTHNQYLTLLAHLLIMLAVLILSTIYKAHYVNVFGHPDKVSREKVTGKAVEKLGTKLGFCKSPEEVSQSKSEFLEYQLAEDEEKENPEAASLEKHWQQQWHGKKKDHLEQVAVTFICALVLRREKVTGKAVEKLGTKLGFCKSPEEVGQSTSETLSTGFYALFFS